MKIKIILKSIVTKESQTPINNVKEISSSNTVNKKLDNITNYPLHQNATTINTPHSKSTRNIISSVEIDPAMDYLIECVYKDDNSNYGTPINNKKKRNSSNSFIVNKLLSSAKKNEEEGSVNTVNKGNQTQSFTGMSQILPNFNTISFNDKIVDLKGVIASQTGMKLGSFDLFRTSEGGKTINDNEEVSHFLTTGLNSPSFIFYFKKTESLIRVVIEYYQNSIDKIIFELSCSCQIHMLKYLINKKLNNSFPMHEQNLSLLGLGALNTNQLSKNFGKLESNINFNNFSPNDIKDEDTLNSLILNNENCGDFLKIHPNSMKVIYLFLARKGERKCSIGIDFSFALLKNLKKLNFENNAPSFREASDGLNIFCYCKNKNCSIYNQMFIKCIGFGTFDLIREIGLVGCFKCGDYKQVEARNLGFVNCEWGYRGMLLNKNSSIVTGDGFTIDDKIYVMKETDLLSQIDRLEITVKSIRAQVSSPQKQLNNNINKDPLNSNSLRSLDSQSSSFDDLDVQFSIKRKDLFGSGHYKAINNQSNLLDINNPQSLLNNTFVDVNNIDYKTGYIFNPEGRNYKKSELDISCNMDTNNGFLFNKNDELEIKLDNKKQNTCCSSFSRNTKGSCIIY